VPAATGEDLAHVAEAALDGLQGAGDRKSVQPMAHGLGLGSHD
jgi:hypothetical protein